MMKMRVLVHLARPGTVRTSSRSTWSHQTTYGQNLQEAHLVSPDQLDLLFILSNKHLLCRPSGEPVSPGLAQPRPVSTGPDQPEPVSTGPDQPGPVSTGPDQPGPVSTGPDQPGPVSTTQVRCSPLLAVVHLTGRGGSDGLVLSPARSRGPGLGWLSRGPGGSGSGAAEGGAPDPGAEVWGNPEGTGRPPVRCEGSGAGAAGGPAADQASQEEVRVLLLLLLLLLPDSLLPFWK